MQGTATGAVAGRPSADGAALAGATATAGYSATAGDTVAGGGTPMGTGAATSHGLVGGDGTPVAPDYEAAVAELESLVERMEDGRFALEESLAAYQRGVDLVRFCREQLAAVEQKVRVLEAGLLQPYEGESSADGDGGDR
jgi:exodeoxyribonuclease VII small subunit